MKQGYPINMSIIRDAFPTFKDHLMVLWRTEINLEVLIESSVAKTLKYL